MVITLVNTDTITLKIAEIAAAIAVTIALPLSHNAKTITAKRHGQNKQRNVPTITAIVR